VHLEESQQLSQQPVTGKLESHHGTLEALQKVCADQPYDLLLTILLKLVDRLVIALVPGEWVVHWQGEERIRPLECLLEHLEQPPIGLPDGVLRHLRRLPLREHGGRTGLPDLALARVRPAPLDDELLEDVILPKNGLSRRHHLCSFRDLVPDRLT